VPILLTALCLLGVRGVGSSHADKCYHLMRPIDKVAVGELVCSAFPLKDGALLLPSTFRTGGRPGRVADTVVYVSAPALRVQLPRSHLKVVRFPAFGWPRSQRAMALIESGAVPGSIQ
jgi:hypothetical protein